MHATSLGRHTAVSLPAVPVVDSAQSIRPFERRTVAGLTGNCDNCRSRLRKKRLLYAGGVEVAVQEREGTDRRTNALSGGSVLKDDLIGGTGHEPDVRVLKGGHPGISWEGIKEDDLEKGPDVRKEAVQMVQQLGCQHVPDGASVPKLTSKLSWGATKMTK